MSTNVLAYHIESDQEHVDCKTRKLHYICIHIIISTWSYNGLIERACNNENLLSQHF